MDFIRVKGVNSEYAWKGDGIAKVGNPEELFLKLFICPYGKPSAIETDPEDSCKGLDSECPQEGDDNPGHALIELNENKGVEIVTGQGYRIKLGQDGVFSFFKGEEIYFSCSEDKLKITLKDNLAINIGDGKINLSVRKDDKEAKVEIDDDGNIGLTPAADGKVTINGNLEVTGTINEAPFPP